MLTDSVVPPDGMDFTTLIGYSSRSTGDMPAQWTLDGEDETLALA